MVINLIWDITGSNVKYCQCKWNNLAQVQSLDLNKTEQWPVNIVVTSTRPYLPNEKHNIWNQNLIKIVVDRYGLLTTLNANVHSVVNKIDDLIEVLKETGVAIICLTETWLNDSILDESVCIPWVKIAQTFSDWIEIWRAVPQGFWWMYFASCAW